MALREMHHERESKRVVLCGRPHHHHTDNTVTTSKYTLFTFLPIAIREQFKRNGNVYFLLMGILMAIGWYSDAFDSAISPWTTLGPLALVVSISLAQEGAADVARHRSDNKMNRHPCVILVRASELDSGKGGEREDSVNHGNDISVRMALSYLNRTAHPSDSMDKLQVGESVLETPTYAEKETEHQKKVDIAFQKIERKEIRVGNLVLVRNRDMIPADLILLASSTEGGTAYVETSSIDGETNLKLRSSPQIPKRALVHDVESTGDNEGKEAPPSHLLRETLEQAIKRITRLSALGYPSGVSAVANASNPIEEADENGADKSDGPDGEKPLLRRASASIANWIGKSAQTNDLLAEQKTYAQGTKFIAALTSEPPNASVNTYSGKITLPPVRDHQPSIDIPLNAENILLRGAMLRNTEWAIGLSCFTGTDTKLVQNSFETPSKFSRLDHLINRTVLLILTIMLLCVLVSAGLSVYNYGLHFDTLWYLGYNDNLLDPWPYLPDFPVPDWDAKGPNYGQQVFLFITLLNNFVPLSLYVTVEMITLFMMYLINRDARMYHDESDTRAVARSTIVTDLGQIQYIFSDKTGTLTQNVMRFKRCSVDGMAFGAPIEKSRPIGSAIEQVDEGIPQNAFHPLKRLLIGPVSAPTSTTTSKDFSVETALPSEESSSRTLTFNAEMFLRVMSLCHTVVVEKDLDREPDNKSSSVSKASAHSSKNIFHRLRSKTGTEASVHSQLKTVNEEGEVENGKPASLVSSELSSDNLNLSSVRSTDSQRLEKMKGSEKGNDGAPRGYAYQAESPDEGALVSAASLTYGFQLLGRSSAGIQIACDSSSLLSQKNIADGLKDHSITPKALASQTALPIADDTGIPTSTAIPATMAAETRFETWELLAVNKFDSDRKRMSVVVRSPPELGSIPMLLCKGADSAMMDEKVCEYGLSITRGLQEGEAMHLSSVAEYSKIDDGIPTSIISRDDGEDDWDVEAMLGLQTHLGDFASEGLRTLVLGIRVLSEKEVEEWLAKYHAAAKAIKDREAKLTTCALEIETSLHIVGATAIEDKLQDGVPETIHNLEEAGIKLWVLTGDKRETAIEIGYSTKVLTPRMHLTVVSDGQMERIRAQMAMEFIRLIKYGKLPQYRHQALQSQGVLCNCKNLIRSLRSSSKKQVVQDEGERRLAVRKMAEKIIYNYLESPEGMKESRIRRAAGALQGNDQDEGFRNEDNDPAVAPTATNSHRPTVFEDAENLSLTSDDVPTVFSRASSARAALDIQRSAGKLTSVSLRALSIASLTSNNISVIDGAVVDEDVLSLASFVAGKDGDLVSSFDRKKRTILERLFAVDRDVRKGKLNKHLTDEMMEHVHAMSSLTDSKVRVVEAATSPVGTKRVKKEGDINVMRALVIEGAALAHLLGDPLLEELLFAVASCCDSVIACRVSPKQKALLVKLVRNYVSPTPVTLAIGDGANDVGMIQEAHVGVGISGLEGQQAVNASDFAIAQFRFLEDLVLVHGRWNFLRMARVVLFSFYKNAVMAGTMIAFGKDCLYSGTPLYDMWVISMLNFLAGIPILFLGFFDRDLEREYVKRNPIVYKSGPNNEHLTLRVSLRWVLLTVVHIFTLYYLSSSPLSLGGGVTSAFSGLMHNSERESPGDGEGGGLKVYGTTIFTSLIITLAYKVLYESRSIVNGVWPACTCRKDVGEGWPSRLAWTWVGILWGSIGFFFFAMYTYQLVGRSGASSMSPFVMVANHTFNMRSITWMVQILVPTAACMFDVVGKVFGNMYYPAQTQIHCEIQAADIAAARRRKNRNNDTAEVKGIMGRLSSRYRDEELL